MQFRPFPDWLLPYCRNSWATVSSDIFSSCLFDRAWSFVLIDFFFSAGRFFRSIMKSMTYSKLETHCAFPNWFFVSPFLLVFFSTPIDSVQETQECCPRASDRYWDTVCLSTGSYTYICCIETDLLGAKMKFRLQNFAWFHVMLKIQTMENAQPRKKIIFESQKLHVTLFP